MFFTGEYAHTLDVKGRLTIPVQFRGELMAGMYLTIGYDPCLLIYSGREFEALGQKLALLPTTNSAVRAYSRLLLGKAYFCTLDSMGRVLIPPILRDDAGITQEAVIVGQNTILEVWHPGNWKQIFTAARDNRDNILAELARLGV
ncbi:MAG: division/cell wall cluster transcriptional repressor MraZ [Anaerolineae bacterium]